VDRVKVLGAPGGGAGGEIDVDGVDRDGGAVDAVAALTARFEALVSDLAAEGDRRLVALAARWEQHLEAVRLVAVARLAGSSGDARSDRRRARAYLSAGGAGRGRSGRSVNRDAHRAAALASNPRLAEQAAGGGVSGDGIDAVSKAADESTGEIPADLLELVGGLDPDQSAHVVEQYLSERVSAADANAKYAAQMAARRVRRYAVPACGADPGLAGLGIEGPDAIIDQLWAMLSNDADSAYHNAGGRDRAGCEHAQLDHRRFDAALQRLRGAGGLDVSERGSGGGGSRPSVVITLGIDDLAGHGSGRRAATQIGSGPVSDQLVAELAASGDLSAVIVGLDGRPLWLGRSRRHGSVAQHLALVVRDRGCVLCGAAFQRCQAHHIIPWNAPAKGRTDLDNLALLCGACHRRVHDGRETLVRERSASGNFVWTTRPATESELPPPKPIQRE